MEISCAWNPSPTFKRMLHFPEWRHISADLFSLVLSFWLLRLILVAMFTLQAKPIQIRFGFKSDFYGFFLGLTQFLVSIQKVLQTTSRRWFIEKSDFFFFFNHSVLNWMGFKSVSDLFRGLSTHLAQGIVGSPEAAVPQPCRPLDPVPSRGATVPG